MLKIQAFPAGPDNMGEKTVQKWDGVFKIEQRFC